MIALITGATGFAGSTLADYLIDTLHVKVHGVRRPRSRAEFTRDDVEYHEGDITDLAALQRIVKDVQPTHVFHLAAQSFVPLSWKVPKATLNNNIIGTLNVLEAVYRESPSTIVQIAGSSEEYGKVYPEECPITEEQPLRPQSPYGASKVAGEMLGQVYFYSYQLKVALSRAFNHTGPRRGEEFITSKLAKALAEIKLGLRPPVIKVGNMEAIRDFTDVRDTVRAYVMLSDSGSYGVPYNIGHGEGRSIEEVFNILSAASGVKARVEQDPQFMRPADVPLLICDSSKFRKLTGWKPEISFEQTMTDLFAYWLRRSAPSARINR